MSNKCVDVHHAAVHLKGDHGTRRGRSADTYAGAGPRGCNPSGGEGHGFHRSRRHPTARDLRPPVMGQGCGRSGRVAERGDEPGRQLDGGHGGGEVCLSGTVRFGDMPPLCLLGSVDSRNDHSCAGAVHQRMAVRSTRSGGTPPAGSGNSTYEPMTPDEKVAVLLASLP
jgi:hypothetical protein